MKVAFHTLGCKVNLYETNVLMEKFAENGFEIAEPTEKADIYIVNSCTVTAGGDKKTRQILRRFKRQNEDAVIVLTGCFPQAFPDVSEKIPEADIITGSSNRKMLLQYVVSFLQNGEKIIEIAPHEKGEKFETMSLHTFHERTRAFIKIQDGCERYCTYCIIPYARGFVRSKPLEDLKKEVEALAENGYKEIVLVGINLSTYGKGTEHRLVDAVELCASVNGIESVRLGSIEPDLLTDEDLRRMSALREFCPQFHLSLQSGCDETLTRMNRHYDTAFYKDLVDRIRATFENSTITTDIMVGFAGETDEEFSKSVAFLKEIGFAKAHVFPYSIREGTRAAKMTNHIDPQTKEKRTQIMLSAAEETREAFLKTQVGLEEEVLVETPIGENLYEGYTKNYTPVRFFCEENFEGKIVKIKITDCEKDFCRGEIIL
ncbi:MAG: tRNA (N(6)-L-threonylcarbamoyladenosine(37)-C(2))-methylthiotransferase MtaB [Oscillospiraceae bacterium]